jgi:hypothetical protein
VGGWDLREKNPVSKVTLHDSTSLTFSNGQSREMAAGGQDGEEEGCGCKGVFGARTALALIVVVIDSYP